MKRVLYLASIPVPYRTEFFNQLAKKCDLTVVYDNNCINKSNQQWLKSVKINYKKIDFNPQDANSHLKCGLQITRYVLKHYKEYDEIIIGCCNDRRQMIVYLALKLLGKKFSANIDGETYFDDTGMKLWIKKFFTGGAKKIYIAGKQPTKHAKKIFGKRAPKLIPYSFSSLAERDIVHNREMTQEIKREEHFLVIGQYEDYKGVDIALKVAKKFPDRHFRFIGSNQKVEEFKALVKELDVKNVEVIAFLPKEKLEKEYLKCKAFILPSRRECWGLVVNEAASYGTPIISTWGSGGAKEYLADFYPNLLAQGGDEQSLEDAINTFLAMNEKEVQEYEQFLLRKSTDYTIEVMVEEHVQAFE